MLQLPIIVCLAAVMALGGRRAEGKHAAPDDAVAMEGLWKLVKYDRNGTRQIQEQGLEFVFVEGMGALKQGETLANAARYRIDSTTTPGKMDLYGNRGTTKCVYELEGDSLRIAFPASPRGERPATVATKFGDGFTVMTLKRVESTDDALDALARRLAELLETQNDAPETEN